MDYFSQEGIKQRVQESLEKLMLHDIYLLKIDCNERSITHRLGMYLQEEFVGWDVDCEYNRDCDSNDLVKRLQAYIESVQADDDHAKTVFPDIIIHHRGTTENLLVIELKKSTNREAHICDKQKLRAFKEQLNYRYALFLCFYTGSDIQGNQSLLKIKKWI